VQGFGEHPAIEAVEKMGITSQTDPKLEEATKEIYRKEFHTGVLKKNTGKYAGLTVSRVKETLARDFVKENKAAVFYDMSADVICRCLTRCIVKIVSDQWFLNYSNPDWKAKAHEALRNVTLYPEKVRSQFEYVIDWLRDWACAREFGLGTPLPWDEKWVIESLSDSTIYMAYYTIAHYLEDKRHGIKAENLGDAFFDYIFLGRGDVGTVARESGIRPELLEKMKSEFEYWYPFDFRNSGKDLVQNHLTFCLFNHVAIFPKKYWPRGIGVNGFIQVDGAKMSKSKGNFYTLRQIYEKYGADITRITLMYGGEGLDDPNWDSEFARSIGPKLAQWYEFAIENYGKGRDDSRYIDRWFKSVVNRTIRATTEAMEATAFRTAIQKGYFDLQAHLKWYAKRTDFDFNKELIDWFIETQTKLLAPFVPHICEEIWAKLGKETLISVAEWPQYDESAVDEEIESAEECIKRVISDIKEIMEVARIKGAKTAYIYTAEDWKWKVLEIAAGKEVRDAMQAVMKDPELRKRGKEVSTLVQRISSERIMRINEGDILAEAKDFIAREIGIKVEVNADYDPQNKRRLAIPGRPAIYIE